MGLNKVGFFIYKRQGFSPKEDISPAILGLTKL